MNIDEALDQLAGNPDVPLDLAELALHLAREEYAELDAEAYLAELSGMAHEARRYISGDLGARVDGLCRYLFHDMGFRGNVREYYDPKNSYLNHVLDRRTGIPITLSLVAMTVGQRGGLHVLGVGLPGHFVVKAVEGGDEVLFDPFHGGRRLTLRDCENLVEQVTGSPFLATPDALRPVSRAAFVARMVGNLKAIYLHQGDHARAVRVLGRLRQLDPHDASHRRDLGISLLGSGQPGPAIDHLGAYLQEAGGNADAVVVRQLLERARAELARWN
jgi:regulator of sirC expression with transglutaminase-like and TPR domain